MPFVEGNTIVEICEKLEERIILDNEDWAYGVYDAYTKLVEVAKGYNGISNAIKNKTPELLNPFVSEVK